MRAVITISMNSETLAQLDSWAGERGLSRPKAIEALLGLAKSGPHSTREMAERLMRRANVPMEQPVLTHSLGEPTEAQRDPQQPRRSYDFTEGFGEDGGEE